MTEAGQLYYERAAQTSVRTLFSLLQAVLGEAADMLGIPRLP